MTPRIHKKIKVMAADDHHVALSGYKEELENTNTYELIGTAYNGQELLEQLVYKEPDVIILDLEMPGMNGHEALLILRKDYPHIKILISSFHSGPVFVAHYMTNGAHGYLPKGNSENLVMALDQLMQNKYYFDTSVSKVIISEYEQMKKLSFLGQLALDDLEIQIVKLLCRNNLTNREIAEKLNMSPHTVGTKRRIIYSKINCSSLSDLLKYALKQGIITLD